MPSERGDYTKFPELLKVGNLAPRYASEHTYKDYPRYRSSFTIAGMISTHA